MRGIRIESARRWDFGLACGSLSLVMLVATGALHSQHHIPRSAQALSAVSFAKFALVKRPDGASRPQR
jgi:hypothetical protein